MNVGIIARPTVINIAQSRSTERGRQEATDKSQEVLEKPQANNPVVKMATPAREAFLNSMMSTAFPAVRIHPAITNR
jgi:hypothetical protein